MTDRHTRLHISYNTDMHIIPKGMEDLGTSHADTGAGIMGIDLMIDGSVMNIVITGTMHEEITAVMKTVIIGAMMHGEITAGRRIDLMAVTFYNGVIRC